MIAALGAALDYIAAQADGNLVEGRKKLVDNAETIAAMTRAAVVALGMKLFAPDSPSAAATSVLPPEGIDSGVIVKELKSRFAAVITNGQGEMKGQIFRIAHLGFFDFMDTIAFIGALEQVVAKSFPPPTSPSATASSPPKSSTPNTPSNSSSHHSGYPRSIHRNVGSSHHKSRVPHLRAASSR